MASRRSWRCFCFQSGGFYSAEDADSYPTVQSEEKQEGAFCAWTAEEIRQLLPDPIEGNPERKTLADVFMHHYGVKENGNVNPMKVQWERAGRTLALLLPRMCQGWSRLMTPGLRVGLHGSMFE